VLVADYLFRSRMRIDVPALFDPQGPYGYAAGFNLVAVAWTVIGVLVYSFLVPAAWLPAVATLLASGLGYLLTARLLGLKAPP
jgi:NCS1 family nucleobase:cation symporter-1